MPLIACPWALELSRGLDACDGRRTTRRGRLIVPSWEIDRINRPMARSRPHLQVGPTLCSGPRQPFLLKRLAALSLQFQRRSCSRAGYTAGRDSHGLGLAYEILDDHVAAGAHFGAKAHQVHQTTSSR